MFFRNSFRSNALVTGLLVAGLATASVGCKGKKTESTTEQKPEAVAQELKVTRGVATGENDSDTLPIGNSFVKGNPDAPVTIVEFSDMQCPFCEKGHETIKKLTESYPDKIRVVFKNFPLPFHGQAKEAAYAAMAAGEQGKFWEMQDKLFSSQGSFKEHASDMKAWTTELAKELGLDTAKFQSDYDAASKSDVIDKDTALGSKVGVNGTPAFFINGQRLVGAQPYDKFEDIVKNELNMIDKLGNNVAKADLYKTRVDANYKEDKPAPENKPKQVIEMVPVKSDDPVRGNTKDALVTIVEFSDFQCPFCGKVTPTLSEIEKNFGKQVRVIFKQNPLGFHANAEPAARAAVAAGLQGKFWEMHDKLFANQQALSKDLSAYEKFAKELGLNVKKFAKDWNSDAVKQKVQDDLKLAQSVGARGTPNFFINGVQLVGAQPYSEFESAIKQQLAIAQKLAKDKNLSGDALYEEVVKYNKSNVEPEGSGVDMKALEQGNAYAKGPDNAPITITEFSDFQCPFCSRGTNNLNTVLNNDKYKGKIRVVFKNYPLPFHKGAEPAARAALAAGKQGKFWEMHDKLFANQQAFGSGDASVFQNFAKELGLNMDKFNKDFDSDELKNQVAADMKQGSAVGVNGTPAFFVNDVFISGAQPPDAFEKVIDQQLSK